MSDNERLDRIELAITALFDLFAKDNEGDREMFAAQEAGHAKHGPQCKRERACLAEQLAAEGQRIAEARRAWGENGH